MSIYVDPNRLFRIALPSGFSRVEGAEALMFRHEDFPARINVSCYRAQAPEGGQAPDLFEKLPSRDKMENVERRTEGDLRRGYGEYVGEFQNEPILWRWWTMQRGEVCVVVSFTGNPDDDALSRDPLNEFVKCVSVTTHAPMPAEDFTELAARVYGAVIQGALATVRKPLELATGENSLLRLENAYISYLDAHDAKPDVSAEELLKNWLERLWGTTTEKLTDFREVRGLIYPVLKPASFARDVAVPVLRQELVKGELDVLMALDTGRTLRFLSHEDLKGWTGVTLEDVFFYARENLLALCRDMQMNVLTDKEGKPAAAIVSTGDNYDASKLILPDLYHKLAAVLGPDLAVGVPNRDFMIIFNLKDDDLVQNISAQVATDAQHRPYAISGKIFRLSGAGVSLLEA